MFTESQSIVRSSQSSTRMFVAPESEQSKRDTHKHLATKCLKRQKMAIESKCPTSHVIRVSKCTQRRIVQTGQNVHRVKIPNETECPTRFKHPSRPNVQPGQNIKRYKKAIGSKCSHGSKQSKRQNVHRHKTSNIRQFVPLGISSRWTF